MRLPQVPSYAGASCLAAWLALSLAGCGHSALDTARAERRISALVAQATGQPATVSCPRDVPLATGRRTVCSLRGRDGSRASAVIVQANATGTVNISSALMHTALVQQRIARDASSKLHAAVRVDCPDLIEISAGSRVRCSATDARGRVAPVFVRITDANGSFTYSIPPRR